MNTSIIILSYNEKEYISEAVESCIRQDIFSSEYGRKNNEIIITDDGSNDGTIEEIKKLKNKYPDIIKYNIMERNNIGDIIPSLRASNAIKKGVLMSTGKYIQILSADDLFNNDSKISKSVNFLEDNVSYASCYTDYKMFWENNKEDVLIYKKKNYSRAVLWSYEYRHISCYLFRRSVINNLLDRLCDDTGFLYSAFITGKTKYIPMLGFSYRQRNSGITKTSNDIDRNLVEILLMQDVFNSEKVLKSSYARFFTSVVFIFKSRKKISKEKYKKYFVEANKYNNNFLNMIIEYDSCNIHDKINVLLLLSKLLIYKVIYKCIAIWENFIKKEEIECK